MRLYYVIQKEVQYDLDIKMLVDEIINDGEPIDDSLIYLFSDNVDYYLDKVGFHDSDCLYGGQINSIIEEVTKEIGRRVENKELESIS